MSVNTDLFCEILAENANIAKNISYIKRNYNCPYVPGKASVVIGIRRCGKSTFLKQTADLWLDKKECIPEQLLFINFSDERLYGIKHDDLRLLTQAHYKLNPKLSKEQGIFYFLDEIQLVENWELFIDRILRNHKNRVILTGSSAKLLSTEIATEMRGRSLAIEMFPFNLGELYNLHIAEPTNQLSVNNEKERGKIDFIAQILLYNGGFPEIQKLDNTELFRSFISS
jgi:uncharacterized protein